MNSDHSPPSVVAGLKQLVACQLALPVNAVKLKKTRRVFDILLFGKRTSADVRHICVHSGRVFLSIFFRPMLTHTLTLTHSHTHTLTCCFDRLPAKIASIILHSLLRLEEKRVGGNCDVLHTSSAPPAGVYLYICQSDCLV